MDFIIWLILITVVAYCAYWTYRDAITKGRNFFEALIWALCTAFFFCLAFPTYLLFIRNGWGKKETMK